jgi:S1-C subfamily serine protease
VTKKNNLLKLNQVKTLLKKVFVLKAKIVILFSLITFILFVNIQTTLLVLNYSAQKETQMLNRVSESVVWVGAPSEPRGHGTGFSVETPSGGKVIVTNDHVCEAFAEEGKIALILKDKSKVIRSVIMTSETADLCLIEGVPSLPALKLAKNKPKPADDVWVVGYPLSHSMNFSKGKKIGELDIDIAVWSNTTPEKEAKCNASPKRRSIKIPLMMLGFQIGELNICVETNKNVTEMNAFIFPGNSGSPVVDTNGYVVGVAFVKNDKSNFGFAVSLDELKTLLKNF